MTDLSVKRRGLTRPVRRALTCVGIFVFLIVYIVVAVTIAGVLPPIKWIQTTYLVVAGLIWGVPLLPLISWSEKPDPKP